MKNRILIILFVTYNSLISAQINEIGISYGGSNYVGDVGSNYYIYPNKPSGAIFYKYNWNPRIALRATYSFIQIHNTDKNVTDIDFRKDRGLPFFKNRINELAVGIEFNFYEYDLSSNDKSWTPYFLAEFAAFNYTNVQSNLTSGLIVKGNKTSIAIPFGVGIKSKLYKKFAFAIETKFRYTFEDDLDYVSNNTPNINVEGTGNDWYMFTGFSLIYTFGRPACYTKGF